MKYVALLRGIGPMNPNMRNDKLRGVLDDLGLKNVQSVVSSGNVLFETDSTDVKKLEATIEEAWPKKLGFNSTTIVRSQKDLESLVALDPFKGVEHTPSTNLNVTFLKNKPSLKLTFPVQPDNRDYKLSGQSGNAVFSVIDLTSSKTPDLMTWLEKQFGKEITTRTWKTINRIIKKF